MNHPVTPQNTQTGRPTSPTSTAVLAGCGKLGIPVGIRLAKLGYHVLGLRRSPGQLPAGITTQALDLRRQQPTLPSETSLIVIALTADTYTAEAYRDTYVTGLDHVLAAADRDVAVPPRIVLVSSTAVYGVTDGSWIDEGHEALPRTATGTQLREAERLLHTRRPDATVLRLAGLYGPGSGHLMTSIRDGTATIPTHDTFTNRIHRDDAARALVHLGTRATNPDPLYLGVDHEPVERGVLLRFVAEQLGLPEPATTTETTDRGRGKRCRNNRLRASGYTFHYPTYREGYRALIEGGP